jgi:hypothetical protein
LAKLRNHVRRRFDSVGRPYQQVYRAERFLFQPESLANAALDAVAIRCPRGVLTRYQDTEPRAPGSAPLDEESVTLQAAPPAMLQQVLEISLFSQSAGRIEPETLARRGYSPSRLRPRARRLRNTARPPGVRLRTRNPWRRARRVLEG